jgi:hypothetical protein
VTASDDRTRTQHPRVASGGAREPFLFLALRADDPAATVYRYALAALERVEVGRGHALPRAVDRTLHVELPDPWLSTRHLLFERALGQWTVRDLDTKNGTRVNAAATRGARLDDGDVVEAGSCFFVFRRAALPTLPAVTSADPRLAEASLADGPDAPEDLALHLARALRDADAPRPLRVDPDAAVALLRARPLPREFVAAAARAALAADGVLRAAPPAPAPAPTAPRRADGAPALTRDGEVWRARWRDESATLRDLDGVRYLAELLARPGVEVPAVDLLPLARKGRADADAPPGVDASGARAALDDALPGLDATARAAYERRLHDLRDAEEEARAWGDRERAAKARAEMEALAAELARAVGLGGRGRATGSTAERVRVNVTLRLRAAIQKIAEQAPALGHHLDTCVRTGAFCAYVPPPEGAR